MNQQSYGKPQLLKGKSYINGRFSKLDDWGCMIDLGKIMIGDLGMYDLVDDLDTC